MGPGDTEGKVGVGCSQNILLEIQITNKILLFYKEVVIEEAHDKKSPQEFSPSIGTNARLFMTGG